MTKTAKYLLLSALFCLALLCYFVGSVIGAIAFIALGLLLEIALWVGIFKSSKKHSHS
ncbi:hypothetical protein [Aliiglaciecola lipolytica]|uniref:Uncharacterized protein n=1 Tax=Aliiglaciecola lipolytica E3 TaxID=1127673 RepID=K6YXP9_9ALTE|nr:hypothetical protein [Aliiglaciecola lipolytica]GAC16010.1 hypothetical protein GLIP_3396 [Aliiglaciecola lipolytica E3]